MAYSAIPTRTASDNVPISTDINQLNDNIVNTRDGSFIYLDFAAGDFDYPASNPAPLDTDTSGAESVKRQLFDDSTNETVIKQFQLPNTFDTSGTITFYITGYAVTAAASKSVVYDFTSTVISAGDAWDTASITKSSGTLSTQDVQDDVDIFSFTHTASSMGWNNESEFIRFKLTRDAVDGNDILVGDYGVTHFRIKIPVFSS